jgi:hypothetical protein
MRHFFASRVQNALHTGEAQSASQSAGVVMIGLECTCAGFVRQPVTLKLLSS